MAEDTIVGEKVSDEEMSELMDRAGLEPDVADLLANEMRAVLAGETTLDPVMEDGRRVYPWGNMVRPRRYRTRCVGGVKAASEKLAKLREDRAALDRKIRTEEARLDLFSLEVSLVDRYLFFQAIKSVRSKLGMSWEPGFRLARALEGIGADIDELSGLQGKDLVAALRNAFEEYGAEGQDFASGNQEKSAEEWRDYYVSMSPAFADLSEDLNWDDVDAEVGSQLIYLAALSDDALVDDEVPAEKVALYEGRLFLGSEQEHGE